MSDELPQKPILPPPAISIKLELPRETVDFILETCAANIKIIKASRKSLKSNKSYVAQLGIYLEKFQDLEKRMQAALRGKTP